MKRIISFFLSVVLLIIALPTTTIAHDSNEEFTAEQRESIYSEYKDNENMLNVLFSNDSNLVYWSMVNNINQNKVLSWMLDQSSKLIGEYPDKQDYAEILANLMTMQEGELAEQIEIQSRFDNLMGEEDYFLDAVDIAISYLGESEALESVSPIIDAVSDGKNVIVDNIEQAKYYELTIQEYSQAKEFLWAISQYAENENLRDTATSLLDANDALLEKRLEYLSNSTEIFAKFEAKFFVDNMSFNLLKSTNIYTTDDTVRWFVDSGEVLQKSILSSGEFAFNMTMLAGNIGFGTNNTFNRYQEMKVLGDVAEAIVKANREIGVSDNYDEEENIKSIQKKCNYYKMLLVTHARGEYLAYQLLTKDASLLSEFRVLFDYFKDPEDTTESWYNDQIKVLLEYYEILDSIFDVSVENV